MGLAKRVVQGLQDIVNTVTILPGLAEEILSKVAHAKVSDLGQPPNSVHGSCARLEKLYAALKSVRKG